MKQKILKKWKVLWHFPNLLQTQYCVYTFSCQLVSDSLRPHGLQHPGLSGPHHFLEFTQFHVHWIHDTIQPSHPLLSPFPPAFNLPSIRSYPVSQLFASSGQSIRTSALASVLPMSIQGWYPLGLTGLISLLFKCLSRVFSSTTVWKHQFFGALPSLWSNSHICIWLLERS